MTRYNRKHLSRRWTARRVAGLARNLVVVGAVSILGACTYIERFLPPNPSQPAASTSPSSGNEPKIDETKAVATLPKPPPGKPAPPPRPAITRLDPNTLVGLDEQQVAGILGTPKGVREQPPARLWSYSAEGCEFELFFFLDLASRKFHVLTYEAKLVGSSRRDDNVNLCLGRIRMANRGREP